MACPWARQPAARRLRTVRGRDVPPQLQQSFSVHHSSSSPAPPEHASPQRPPADGSLEDFDEAGAGSGGNKKETAEEAAARLKLEAAKARESVRWARLCGAGRAERGGVPLEPACFRRGAGVARCKCARRSGAQRAPACSSVSVPPGLPLPCAAQASAGDGAGGERQQAEAAGGRRGGGAGRQAKRQEGDAGQHAWRPQQQRGRG